MTERYLFQWSKRAGIKTQNRAGRKGKEIRRKEKEAESQTRRKV